MNLEVTITVRDKDAADTASPLFQGVYDPEKDPEKDTPLFPALYNPKVDLSKQPWWRFTDPPEGAPVDLIGRVLMAVWRACDQRLSMPK